jgi:ribosomal protein L31
MRRSVPVFLIATCMVFAMPFSLTFAQTDDSTDSAASTDAPPFTLDISPQYPTPYSTVTVTPQSDSFDIAGAKVSVTVNGTSFYKGSGSTGIAIPVGGPGSATTISVTAVSGGQSYNQKVSLHPADVALVVEPISSTHPFYAGEGLVPSEGRVRLIAIPDLRTSSSHSIDPSTLVYTWSLGDQVLDGSSGIGKNVLDASAPQQYRDADITLSVATQDGSIEAQTETTITPVDPLTRIYEDDPLLGPLFDNAISDSYTMTNAEDTFLGVPYYFSTTPTLDWTVNSADSGSQPDITVRSTGNGAGTAVLNFTANNSDSSESANSTVSVLFGQKHSTGLFGL